MYRPMLPVAPRLQGMKRIAAVVIGAALALALAAPADAQAYVPADESKVLSMVNATRSAKGLKKLVANDELKAMAREQADRMEAKGDIFHNPNLAADIVGTALDWLRVGENVGVGPNVYSIEDAFLASPGHYANIVRAEYNVAGIGVVDGDDGRRYVVQVFASVKGSAPAPAAPAPKPAAPKPAAPAVTPAVKAAPQVQAPAPAPATPKPTPRPVTADPNALTGGYVNPVELPVSDLGLYPDPASKPQAAGIGHLIDILAFWA